MNKQQLINKYKELRRAYCTHEGNETYMYYNYLCILLDNYETMEEVIQEVKDRLTSPITLDGYDIYVTFLLDVRGEY